MTGISFTDIGAQWFEDIVETVTQWFESGLRDGYADITESLFRTPLPDTDSGFVFGTPQNEPWGTLHNSLVGGEIVLIALLIIVICVQARHTVQIFDLGSRYEHRKARRSAWTGGILIVTWYWTAVVSLLLVDGFTVALVPDSAIVGSAMADFLQVTITNSALTLILAMVGGFAMWLLQALFFLREILLYVFVYAMPIVVAIAYGNLPVLSTLAHRVSIKFVPLAVMPLPVALLFRGYELLFADGPAAAIAPDSAFFRYLVAVSLPVLSVWIVWKLFAYATPRIARTIRTVTGATLTTGAVAGASAVAGPWAGATAARWGPKAAIAQTLASRFGARDRRDDAAAERSRHSPVTRTDGTGAPSYRRTENDPRP